eukprot:12228699-Karenia_brevis.AAC.1
MVASNSLPSAQIGDIITLDHSRAKVLDIDDAVGAVNGPKTVKVGVFWSKDEFIAEAMSVVHPFDRKIKVPARVASLWHRMAEAGPSNI